MTYTPEIRIIVDKLKAGQDITDAEKGMLLAEYEKQCQEAYEEHCREDLKKQLIKEEEKQYKEYMNELVEWEEGVCVTREFALSCITEGV